jgi:alkylated DNA repair dioxygenase AlkB
MQTIIDRPEATGRASSVVVLPRAISADYECELLDCLNRMDDFRGGSSSFGPIPRLQKWYNMSGDYFSPSWADQTNPRWTAMPTYDPFLLALQERLQAALHDAAGEGAVGADVLRSARPAARINSCLVNKYRNGQDSIKPHRDSEAVFGADPTVLVLSLGAVRTVVFERIVYDPRRLQSIKPDRVRPERVEVALTSGSLLVMCGATQKYYSHAIQKCDRAGVRYSLTFREFDGQSVCCGSAAGPLNNIQ